MVVNPDPKKRGSEGREDGKKLEAWGNDGDDPSSPSCFLLVR